MPPTIWARPKLTAAALADLCITVFVNAADQILLTTILIPNFFGFIMLLVATLFRAATLFAKRDAVRVGVVLGVNNGTNEEGVGRALTSDQEQWCANEGELLSLLYSIVHLQAGIALH